MIRLDRLWRVAEAAPRLDFCEIVGEGGLIVIAPHPDDETLGCGGLLADAAARGVPCRVVLVTDGSRSHPNSPAWPPTRLASRRLQEISAALGQIGHGAEALVPLAFEDGAAPIDGPALDDAVAEVTALCIELCATALFASWGEDPHHDHQAAAALAAGVAARLAALRHYAYPIWARTRDPGDLIDASNLSPVRLATGERLAAKRAALACHPSQLGLVVLDDPSGFVMPDDFIERFMLPDELFFRIDPHDQEHQA